MKARLCVACIAIAAIIISGCATPGSGDRTPIDQVPMYGPMDRAAVPQLRAADEQLIAGTTKHYGSREAASTAFADQGFRFYQANDNEKAMRRFNQAWLLNPENGDAYWGFASILNDRKDYCEAAKHMRTALTKPGLQKAALPDAGLIFAGCSASLPAGDTSGKDALKAESEKAFESVIETNVSKDYVFLAWARAKAWTGDFSGAWGKVREYRVATGKEPPQDFLTRLRQQMPEPRS